MWCFHCKQTGVTTLLLLAINLYVQIFFLPLLLKIKSWTVEILWCLLFLCCSIYIYINVCYFLRIIWIFISTIKSLIYAHQISTLKWFSYCLAAVFTEYMYLEARFWVENEDVVGAAPTADAPTTSEWSTVLLATKVRLILEVLRYYSVQCKPDISRSCI